MTVSRSHDVIDRVALATGPQGDLLSWRFNDLHAGGVFGPGGVRFAVAPPGGGFGTEQVLPASFAAQPLQNLGGGLVAQLILRGTGPATSEPRVVLGNVSGSFGTPLAVRGSVWAGRASLAGDRRGDLLVTWLQSSRHGLQVWASVRAAGRRFGAPQLIQCGGGATGVLAAMGPPAHSTARGGLPSDMAIAFSSSAGRMLASVRPHGGDWGRAQDVGPAARGTLNEMALHISRDGRVILAWHHQQLSEGGPLGPGYTQVAVRPPGAARFRPPQTLERDPGAALPASPVIVQNGGRGFIVAFLAQPGSPSGRGLPSVVRVSYGRDRFGSPGTISIGGQSASDLAGAEGAAGDILSWSSVTSSPVLTPGPAVYASVSRPGSLQLGSPARVSPEERAEVAVPIGYETSDRWLIAWAGRPDYRSPFSPGRAVLRLSACEVSCS